MHIYKYILINCDIETKSYTISKEPKTRLYFLYVKILERKCFASPITTLKYKNVKTYLITEILSRKLFITNKPWSLLSKNGCVDEH